MNYDTFMMDIFLPGSTVVAIASAWLAWRLAMKTRRGALPTALIAVMALALPVVFGALYVLINVLARGGPLIPEIVPFSLEAGIELAVIGVPVSLIALAIARIKSRKTIEA